jgi:cell division transport system ATP-binding protein
MIEFQGVSKTYSRDAFALQNVSLNVNKGELVYLAGPSGAGKSTLLKMIAAIERPTSGRVIVNGQDIGKLKRSSVPFLRRNLGLIFQQQRLLNDRSILANAMLPLLVSGSTNAKAEQRARAALDKVGLLDRAATCGDCPRHRQPAANHPGRRTDRQPRPRRGRQGARRIARIPLGGRDLHDFHPR